MVDRYDGRGAWTTTEGLGHRWSLAEARRQASKLTRLTVNDGFNRPRLTEKPRCEHRHYDGRQCGHRASGDEKFCGHHRWIHDRADVAEKSPDVAGASLEVAEKSPPVTSVIPGREMTKAERAAARERIAPSPRIEDGDECSICRRTHGLEVIHACE